MVLGLHAARPPATATAELTVARRDVPAGAVLTPDDLTRVAVPPALVPAGARSDAAGRVLATGLRRGEPVTDARLIGPGLTAGHPDLVAVPIRLPDAAMAALLRPGDHIRLLATDPQAGTTVTAADDALVLALPASDAPDGKDGASASSGNAVMTGLGGRLVVVGIPEIIVTRVTSAAVKDFLTYAYPH